MRIPEVPHVFRKICVSQFKLGFLYFSWLFSTKQTRRRFGSLTRKPSSKIGRSLGDRPIIQIPGFAEWTFFVFLPLFIIFSLVHTDSMFIKEKFYLDLFFERNIQENIYIYIYIYMIYIYTLECRFHVKHPWVCTVLLIHSMSVLLMCTFSFCRSGDLPLAQELSKQCAALVHAASHCLGYLRLWYPK